MGAIAVSIINIVTDALKPGWTYTLGGGLVLLTWPMIVVNLRIGPKWRRNRQERQRREERERAEENRARTEVGKEKEKQDVKMG